MMLLDDPLSRAAARELARRELHKRAYEQAKPSLVVRLLGRAISALRDLFARASAHVPGGRSALVIALVVLVGLVVLVVLRLQPSTFGRKAPRVLFTSGQALSAAEHRRLAEEHASRGEWAEAVRERLRAVVRDLEARGVLDPRPARTADEVAREAGGVVSSLADPLFRAATTFDEIWYGGRSADAQSYQVLVDVDRVVAATKMVLA